MAHALPGLLTHCLVRGLAPVLLIASAAALADEPASLCASRDPEQCHRSFSCQALEQEKDREIAALRRRCVCISLSLSLSLSLSARAFVYPLNPRP